MRSFDWARSLGPVLLGPVLLCMCGLACTSKPGSKAGGAAAAMGAAGVSVRSGGAPSAGGGTSGTAGAGHTASTGNGGASAGRGGAPSANGGNGAALAGRGGGPAPDAAVPSTDDAGQAPDGGAPQGMVAIDAPVPDDCIKDVSAGDHTFTCQGQTFLVMVDAQCTKVACGLIFDVHGAAMSGDIMRSNTHLHELAPSKGYLVVHPSANGGTWDLQADPPILADFMSRMIAAFHVDQKRVHITGFSMGSAMTFWFLCNHKDVLASTAPVTGSSAEQVTVVGSGSPCIASIDASWKPRVPILFMSGTMDNALTIDAARARTDGIVTRLGLTGGTQIDGDATFTRKRWTGADGMVFDFIEHNYSNALLGGHCIPNGSDGGFIACTAGGNMLHWGEVVLQWFVEHPKP